MSGSSTRIRVTRRSSSCFATFLQRDALRVRSHRPLSHRPQRSPRLQKQPGPKSRPRCHPDSTPPTREWRRPTRRARSTTTLPSPSSRWSSPQRSITCSSLPRSTTLTPRPSRPRSRLRTCKHTTRSRRRPQVSSPSWLRPRPKRPRRCLTSRPLQSWIPALTHQPGTRPTRWNRPRLHSRSSPPTGSASPRAPISVRPTSDSSENSAVAMPRSVRAMSWR